MNTENLTSNPKDKTFARPFILSILCVAIGTYTAVLIVSFGIAVIFNEWVAQTLNDFFEDKSLPTNLILWFALSGLLINLLTFFSIIKIWYMKRWGFYIYVASSLLFVLFPFFIGFGNIYSVIIIVTVIGLLSLFFKRYS